MNKSQTMVSTKALMTSSQAMDRTKTLMTSSQAPTTSSRATATRAPMTSSQAMATRALMTKSQAITSTKAPMATPSNPTTLRREATATTTKVKIDSLNSVLANKIEQELCEMVGFPSVSN